MQPNHLAHRHEFVDALRGFALIGVFGANLFVFSGYIFMTEVQRASLPTAGIDKIVYLLETHFHSHAYATFLLPKIQFCSYTLAAERSQWMREAWAPVSLMPIPLFSQKQSGSCL